VSGQVGVEQRADGRLFLGVERQGRLEGQLQRGVPVEAVFAAKDQVVTGNREGHGQLTQHPEGRLGPARLVEADLVGPHADHLGEGRLGESPAPAQLAQVLRKSHSARLPRARS